MKPFDMFRGIRHGLLAVTALAAFAVAGCSGGGGGGSTTPTQIAQVAKISLVAVSDTTTNAPKSSVKSDNSDNLIVVATALDANNVVIAGASLAFSSSAADGGELVVTTSKTDASGKLSGTYRAGTGNSNRANRTVTITVKSDNGMSAQLPISVVGTTLAGKLAAGSSSSIPAAGKTTLVFDLKDAGGAVVVGEDVSLSSTGAGSVTFASPVVKTDQNGQVSIDASGAAGGAVTVTATALGAKASINLTVQAGAAFAFQNPPSSSSVSTNQLLNVSAPSAATVVFATSLGKFYSNTGSCVAAGANVSTASSCTAVVNGGVATATLQTGSSGGVASIQAYDKATPTTTASLTLPIGTTDATNAIVTLQATPSTVAVSTDATKNSVTLVATVKNNAALFVQNAPVIFTIVAPSGSGETVGPTVALTDASGVAKTSFVSGTVSGKVQVQASVVGASGVTPGTAFVDVGSQAVSIGISADTTLGTKNGDPNYYMAMSVFVVDPQNNPVNGATVNLSVSPIYFTRGANCTEETVDIGTVAIPKRVTLSFATENPAEAPYFASLGQTISSNGVWSAVLTDSFIPIASWNVPDKFPSTIQPSAGNVGSVPASVTTDAQGSGIFTYVYPKSSAIWHVVRVRARTIVNGTEAVTDKIFRLTAVKADVDPDCHIASSPYN